MGWCNSECTKVEKPLGILESSRNPVWLYLKMGEANGSTGHYGGQMTQALGRAVHLTRSAVAFHKHVRSLWSTCFAVDT